MSGWRQGGVWLCLAGMLVWTSCSRPPAGAPTRMGREKQELHDPLRAVCGIYDDGWIGPSASLQLTAPAGAAVLHFKAMVPGLGDNAFRTVAEFRWNDLAVARHSLALGDTDLTIPVPEGAGPQRVAIRFDRTQRLPGGDARQVGGRLESIAFEPASEAKVQPVGEIADETTVHLGAGWNKLESYAGETFRWAAGEASVEVELAAAHDGMLSMLLEPGPGAGGHPLLLRVLDESGHAVGAILLDRRETHRIAVPLKGGKPETFHLRAEGGGVAAPGDPRVLNFRAFAIDARPLP